ncbi:hypothetical protein Asp14428_48920 [Actinoplanes sp. NBRC 14428]|uniref:Prepilin-type N-terminal cleavage/methylation domain-containing protein n=1 Tax=Pseudosporangium ferrugineum TaxID=439699 RepID=A0A2T0RDA5_9ACTN|nr:pilus assembly PilX N-terminal domain-containing protein [Pseudosporangium ferrugineum]PRY19148.1 hypothetical protein CLV70_13826 [Pseudosporangium ferrugineum]BCJ53417.1 hypothetical protein Asp14428_48920 [Actinoplanes sp. NBRC 14428]
MEDDAGFTLVDLIFSMTVMMIVTAVCTSSLLSMYRTAEDVDSQSAAQAQAGLVFQRLDREVRYARGIADTTAAGAATVDFLAVQGTSEQCLQLRVTGGVLSQRTWAYGESPINPSPWRPLAYGITTELPFTYLPPDDVFGHQRLRITLSQGASANEATFTALNTDRTSGNDYCAAGRTP